MSLFREEAIEAKRRRLWGEVRLSQPPSLAVWTILFSIICIALFAALILGRYTRKETVQGFIEADGGVVDISAVQTGRVSRVLVSEGDTVAKGEAMIEFTSDVAGLGQGPLLDVQLAEADRQDASLSARVAALSRSYDGERHRLREQVEAQQRLKLILFDQRQAQADALALTEADALRLFQLQAQGFAPNAEVDRRRRSVLAERSALADMDSRLSAIDASVAELRSQIASLPMREAETLASLDGEGARLAQRRAELEVARGHQIRAPVSGVVSRVLAREGMTPAGNSPLLSIVPAGSVLQARLLVPTRAAGFLKVGQEARLQVEAFPFQRFGFVLGHVRAIHPTVIRPNENVFPIAQTEPVYEIEVFLSRKYIDAYGEHRPLRPGMLLRADIPIDRRTLWQQLFDPMLAARQRSGG